jgi:hypothetical protein
MADLYILASIPDQGKTTTALLLEKKLKAEGKSVACLQNNKGQYDVGTYLKEGAYHYSLPLEASKNRESFESWVTSGYDAYIAEITFAYSPHGAVFVDLFDNVNEVVSYGSHQNWKEYVSNYQRNSWINAPNGTGTLQDVMSLWEHVRDRNMKQVITKSPDALEGPYVDISRVLHNANELAKETIDPKMKLPHSNKKVITVGAFPGEYWDIFPKLHWFGFDYAGFMKTLRAEQYDLAIIGACGADTLKLRNRPQHGSIICYQPSVYLNLKRRHSSSSLTESFSSIFSTIKKTSPGTPLCHEGEPLSGYNNQYWIYRTHDGDEPVWNDGNTLFCNGWVLPQYLIRDGFLEVT